ncbi:hypothetical protein BG011_003198 [Mortierella polycephala]|uniref:Uncharacterized protein n=1 Tax=Mortierella polycephala TaxID=41804 RepID=A0A9P6PE29_9FUNG|nr:hypothetical protein BG011_003198 [Mortierella polycephala]
MSGANFYKKPKSGEPHNLNLDFPRYPKNTLQNYTAPLVGPHPWPQNSGDDQKVDKLLAKYQEHCALLTKPLDTYAATIIGSNKYDNDHKESVRHFVQLYRSHLADFAHKIADDRNERYLHAKELRSASNDGRETLISSEELAEHVKETQLARSASSKPKSGQHNNNNNNNGKSYRGRGGNRNGRGAYNGWYGPQQYQQPPQTQQSYYPQQQGSFNPAFGQGYVDYNGNNGNNNGHQGGQYFPRGSRGRGRGKAQTTQ